MPERDRTAAEHGHAGDVGETRIPVSAPDRALREQEIAEWLGLSIATLRAWRRRGQGPRFVKFGRSVRYMVGDVEQFVRASAVDPSTTAE